MIPIRLSQPQRKLLLQLDDNSFFFDEDLTLVELRSILALEKKNLIEKKSVIVWVLPTKPNIKVKP